MIESKEEIIRKAETFHYNFQTGMYFSGLKESNEAAFLCSNKIKDFYWNYASQINTQSPEKFIHQTIEFFKDRNRQPAVYITPFTKPIGLSKTLKSSGFEIKSQDAWMFYRGGKPKIVFPKNFKIKKVETQKEMEAFVNIFNRAYGGATPNEPYGALPPDYSQALLESYKQKNKDKKIIHYLGLLENKPVGIATLIYSDEYGGIYNIGTIPAQRGKGISSLLTLTCILEAIQTGAKNVFLQTEQGSYNEKFSSNIGFTTEFIGQTFVLDELVFGAKQAVNVCAKVKANEKVVVITDRGTKNVAEHIIKELKLATKNVNVFVLEDYGKRPYKIPDIILNAVRKSDVIFVIAGYIYGEIPTLYRPLNETVRKNKARMAVMVELNENLLREGMNADYGRIHNFSKKVYDLVKNAKEVRVTTKLGTDFTVKLGYKWVIFDGFLKPGKWVNLPDGEVFTTPKDINGKIVVDGSAEFLGLLAPTPLTIQFKDGIIIGDIECKEKSVEERFKKFVLHSDQNSRRVGEFAFGTNIFLKKLCGNLTQDEKFPSVHIAFGDPHGTLTGAKWESKLHMDAIVLKPTAYIDGKKIMEDGKYLIL